MPETYNYNQNSGQQPMYNPPQYQPQAGMELSLIHISEPTRP